jgi:hypothetical protein
VCDHVAHTGDVVCSQCGALLPASTPSAENNLQTELPRVSLGEALQPTTRLVLQLFPTETCLSIPLPNFLILGRVIPPGPPEVLDLTSFEGQTMGVSRRHCILKRRGQQFFVIDLNAPNGTFLNGQRLDPRQECAIQHGDELKLGKLVIRVYFDTAKA